MTDTLLISTFNRVFVRYPDGGERLLLDKDGPHYGLTWDDQGRLFVGTRCWGNSDRDALYVYDEDLNVIAKHEMETHGQLHQIYWHDGCVYLTDTPMDRIVGWDPDSGESEVVWDLTTDEDQHHLNSLWHSPRFWWVAGLHGDVWVLSDRWHEITYYRYPFEIHNLWHSSDGGPLLLGASDQESIWRDGHAVNLTDHLGVMQDAGDLWQSYTRGLAVTDDRIYVGAAAVQDARYERRQGRSAIAVFDRDLNFVEGIWLEDTGGFHDVRVLGRRDYAHHGIVWEL